MCRAVCKWPVYAMPHNTLCPAAGIATVSGAVHARHDPHTQGRGLKSAKSLELNRLLPLKFVKLSIHSHERKQLHLKFAMVAFFTYNYAPFRCKRRCVCPLGRPGALPEIPMEAHSGTHCTNL